METTLVTTWKKNDLVNVSSPHEGMRQHSTSRSLQPFHSDLLSVSVDVYKVAGELVAFTGGDLRGPARHSLLG